ncbi:YitT family protein [Herbaspirillum huttiense F1]|uniref:YitT family protein n=1 Tax=Herbaspirillum huttiense TaxID=863372 RepID=UPI002884AAE7|nr:YitT family protein [Herbaspirillum huttiense]MDT0358539.1 YitT family protein [Herbaspirillum huttiense F1]
MKTQEEKKFARHSFLDNVQGQVIGITAISFGMSMLASLGLITGQTAGLSFLLSYATGISFGLSFFLVNIPFYLLAVLRMGMRFTLKTLLAVSSISVLTNLFIHRISYQSFDPLIGSILAGLVIGLGLIGLFRHGSSSGGIGILALYVQDKTNFKAGWSQLLFDVALFGAALSVLAPSRVLLSLIGASVLNTLVAWNHRPDWYIAR